MESYTEGLKHILISQLTGIITDEEASKAREGWKATHHTYNDSCPVCFGLCQEQTLCIEQHIC
jgi:hypothetical protein